MSDRIAVFNDGRIQQLASPADLYERPDNSFVAQFIGENNRLRGVTRAIKDGRAEVETKCGIVVPALAVNTAVGAATQISIRPERIAFDPDDAEVSVEARIEEVIYLGDHIRVRLRVFDDDGFVVKLSNGAGRRKIVVGETARVGWAVEDGRALDV
jgi:putative spermidine/putrescine transport system ATP-binding protein